MIPYYILLKVKERNIKHVKNFLENGGDAMEHMEFIPAYRTQKGFWQEFLDHPQWPTLFHHKDDEVADFGLPKPLKCGTIFSDDGMLRIVGNVHPDHLVGWSYFISSMHGWADEGAVIKLGSCRLVRYYETDMVQEDDIYQALKQHYRF